MRSWLSSAVLAMAVTGMASAQEMHIAPFAELHASAMAAYEAAAADPNTWSHDLAARLLNHAIGVQEVSGHAAALPLLEAHYAILRRIDGEAGLETAAASERVWRALFALGRFAEAEANARERYDALAARADFPRAQIARALKHLALSVHIQNRPDDAAPAFAHALRVLGDHRYAGDRLDAHASILDAYALHLAVHGSPEEALDIAMQNLEVRARLGSEDSPVYARGLHTLAAVQHRLGMIDAALASLEAAQAIYLSADR
ncbi:tetratricopeptide repeat protein [Glycocaulis sp.]|uniref:tetratricopeptide repeat protein n=1 Tax=Glycocaulis sp. TaxID=1969725 RepID=UPI003D193BBE